MNKRWFTIARVLVGVTIIIFVTIKVVASWQEIRSAEVDLTFRPGWVLLSLLITWLMYACLITGWLTVLRGWGESLNWSQGARIWVLSSFGKYVPGKVWAIVGMAAMSERAGVRGGVATAAAVVMQLLAIGSGAVLTALAVGGELDAVGPGTTVLLIAGGAVAAVGLMVIGNQSVLNRIWGIVGREGAPPAAPSPRSLLEGIGINFLAWLGYGAALWALARGVLPVGELDYRIATGAFTASYVAGLLAVFAPGGIGVREGLIVLLLRPEIGIGPAIALAAASRLVLTINEIGAALPFVLKRESAA